jgi:transposase
MMNSVTPKIEYRMKYLTPEQEVAIVTDYNAGMKVTDIQKRHGISRVTIYNVLKRVVKKGGEKEDAEQEKNG